MSTIALSAFRFLALELLATLATIGRYAFLFACRVAGRAYCLYKSHKARREMEANECLALSMRPTLDRVAQAYKKLTPVQRVRLLAWIQNANAPAIAHKGAGIISAHIIRTATTRELLAGGELANREIGEQRSKRERIEAERHATRAVRELLARIDGKNANALQCV